MEDEPVIRFNMGDDKVECTPRTTTLYRHLAHHAMYDHVFIDDDEQEDEARTTGRILFLRPALTEEKIDEVTNFMMNTGFETHLNIRKPAKTDTEAFETMIQQRIEQIPDTLEGWEDGTPEA